MSTGVRYSRLFLLSTISGEPHTPTDQIVVWRKLGRMWEVIDDYPVETRECAHLHRTRGTAAACKEGYK